MHNSISNVFSTLICLYNYALELVKKKVSKLIKNEKIVIST